MANITPKRNGEFLKVVFDLLERNPEGVQAKSVLEHVSRNVELTDFEKGIYDSDSHTHQPRFQKIIRFATIPTVKAGWMTKGKGTWRITDEGIKAYHSLSNPEALYREAVRIYRQWRSSQEPLVDEGEEELEEASPIGSVITLEEAQDNAWEQIRDFVSAMDPYDFQQMVADLLMAMDYHVDWVAPRGKDKGQDIIAFSDPLGASTPRIVVQVKHREAAAASKDIREFISVIGAGYVGIFVSSSGFTSDAEQEARSKERTLVTLIDLEKLFDLWTSHYGKLSEQARKWLPLKPVYYLAL